MKRSLPELAKETAHLSTEDQAYRDAAVTLTEQQSPPRIRFACECGHLHVLPTRYVGRKGKCGNCGTVVTVPDADTRPDTLAEQLIGQTVGGCRLFYKIGGGGMGGVFKGRHIALDIPVAVKVLHAHLADKDPICQAFHTGGAVCGQTATSEHRRRHERGPGGWASLPCDALRGRRQCSFHACENWTISRGQGLTNSL